MLKLFRNSTYFCQFWQSAFKFQKTSPECLEKVLKTMSQPRKDRLPKKPSRFEKIQFWQSCWNFSKIVRNFAPKFHETNGSISGKRFSTAYKFPGKKNCQEKINKDRWNANLTIGWTIVDEVRQYSAQILKKFVKSIYSKKKFLNKFIWTQGRFFFQTCQKTTKNYNYAECLKKIIHWKFFGKTRLSSRSPSGNVESLSDNSPDNFPPKNRFIHKIVKPPPPPPLPLLWKKLSNWTFFRG